MPAHADDPRYVEAIRLISASLIDAVPKGADPNLIVNGLLNSISNFVRQVTPAGAQTATETMMAKRQRTEMIGRSIAFLIGEAAEMGVPLDELGRYCQHLATDREKDFYA